MVLAFLSEHHGRAANKQQREPKDDAAVIAGLWGIGVAAGVGVVTGLIVVAGIGIAGEDGQRACALCAALNGEAARSVQGSEILILFVPAGHIDGDIAALAWFVSVCFGSFDAAPPSVSAAGLLPQAISSSAIAHASMRVVIFFPFISFPPCFFCIVPAAKDPDDPGDRNGPGGGTGLYRG